MKCQLCLKTKSKIEFYTKTRKSGKIYTTLQCKKCYNKRVPTERTMLLNSRKRAKVSGMIHTLKLSDIKIPKKCPVLGIELFPNIGGRHTDNSPTIDRINNSKGYTKDNIHIISYRANRAKSDLSLKELQKVLKYFTKFF